MINDELKSIFTDERFQQFGKFRWHAVINGVKVGVVLATRTPPYDGFALNTTDCDRLLAAKRDGRIDLAFVVKTAIDPKTGAMTFCDSFDVEQLETAVLTTLPLRIGKHGPFWVVPPNADDEPF